jgi:hypothetical protein
VEKVLADCEAGWADGYDRAATATAERFVTGQAHELSEIRHHYATALADLRRDVGFLAYLSDHAGLTEG